MAERIDYKIMAVGDSALTIVFGNEIDPEISRIVRGARIYLTRKNIEGVGEYVQTYASLMVHYNPLVIDYDTLVQRIESEFATADIDRSKMKKEDDRDPRLLRRGVRTGPPLCLQARGAQQRGSYTKTHLGGIPDIYAGIYARVRVSGRNG